MSARLVLKMLLTLVLVCALLVAAESTTEFVYRAF